MYIRTPSSWLGEPAPKKIFNTGGEYVGEKDSGKVLAVPAGLSPFQAYIKKVLSSKAAAALPKNFLRIISSPSDVPDRRLRDRFVTDSGGKIVGGTIDRANGIIYLLETPKIRGYSRLEFALHETVHLFAHPFMSVIDNATFERTYGKACPSQTDVGSFQRMYCSGFGEGATQAITEQIMEAQEISKYYSERPYDDYTPPLFEVIMVFGIDRFARAYFWGEINEFARAMEFRWGREWRNVSNLTNARQKDQAVREIKRLEDALRRRTGDFPNPSPYIRSLT